MISMQKATGLLLSLSLVCCSVSCEDSVVLVDLTEPGEVADDPVDDIGDDDTGDDDDEPPENQPIFITDRTGKRWDITHAVKEYGFEPDGFQFGLGPNAIRPIIGASMICPGEDGYPADNAVTRIMGTSLNGETRAYPLDVMSYHEVAIERFGEAHVAVAY